MRRLLVLALVAAASIAAPASASKPGSFDFACGYTSIADPRPQSSYDAQLALVYGGPVTQSGTLTCTIKVGAATHAAPYEHGAVASGTGTHGVTVVPPTLVSFVSDLYLVYLCDQFTDTANVTWYLDGRTDDWTTDPGGSCRLAISMSTSDPFLDPFWDLVDNGIVPLLDDVLVAAGQLACPVLAALSPGAPPLVDVRADGDTYVAGDLLLDCPPADAEPGEALVAPRLGGLWPAAAPPRTAGVIRVSDTGGGPEWEVSGTLVSVDWDCAAEGAGVVCDWDGYFAKPACTEVNAVAAVLAPGARARARVSCVRGTVVESATTGVASAALPVSYAERGTTALPVTSLRCEADDGAGGPPVAPYVTTCGFTFA